MESFTNVFVILVALGFLYLLLKPHKQPKTKAQKQEEIRLKYQQRLRKELSNINDTEERTKKKTDLLKVFAKELEFNLFFDKEEVRVLIQELANY